MVDDPIEDQRLHVLRIGFEIGRAVSRAVRAAIGQEAVIGRQRLAHALDVLGGMLGGEIAVARANAALIQSCADASGELFW
jgi:predicted ATP-dependent Lon-type protease